MNIILIGFMGAGKTSVAEALSTISGFQILDTDHTIESIEGLSISDIFKTKGELYFRDLETQFCIDHRHIEKHIIATGGGMPLRVENQNILVSLGPIIYLNTSYSKIEERLQSDHSRPLAQDPDNFHHLFQERHPIYQALASLEIITDNKSIDEISHEIWTFIDKK